MGDGWIVGRNKGRSLNGLMGGSGCFGGGEVGFRKLNMDLEVRDII